MFSLPCISVLRGPIAILVLGLLLAGGGYQTVSAQEDDPPSSLNVIEPDELEDRTTDGAKNSTLSVTYSYNEENADKVEITFVDADNSSNSATFTFNENDNFSGGHTKTRSLNLASPHTTSGNGLSNAGLYNIEIRATDEFGNFNAIGASNRLMIDRSAPSVSKVSLGNDGNGNLSLSLGASDQPSSSGGDPLGNGTTDLAVTISDPSGSTLHTFNRSEFSESGSGPYTYTLSPTVAYDAGEGDYTATVQTARDEAGNDGSSGQSATYTVTFPNPSDDSYTLDEDNILNVPADGPPNLIDNDGESDNLVASLASGATSGDVTIDGGGDGSFTYEPNQNYNGSDSFSYQVTNTSTGFSSEASVSLTVNPVNDPPTPVDDSYSSTDTGEDITISSSSNGLLTNDEDIDSPASSLSVVSVDGQSVSGGSTLSLSDGTLTITDPADGTFDFKADSDFDGEQTFTYKIEDDGPAISNDSATVTLTVGSNNEPPTIGNIDDRATPEDSVVEFSFTASDQETDIDPSHFSATSSNEDLVRGTDTGSSDISFNDPDPSDGSFRVSISPRADSNGTADITITVTDEGDTNGGPQSASQAFTLTVNSVNDAPTITTNQNVSLDEGTETQIQESDLKTTDVEDGPSKIVYEIDQLPANGDLILNDNESQTLSVGGSFTQKNINDGLIVYKHNGSETTTDSFGFTVADKGGGGKSKSGTVSISVNSVNDEPVLDPISDPSAVKEDEDRVLTFNATDAETDLGPSNFSATTSDDAIVRDSDAADDITFSDPSDGDGSFAATISPRSDANGSVDITITVEDDGSTPLSDSETFTLSVTAVNDAPKLDTNNGLTLDEDTEPTLNQPEPVLAASDVDAPDGPQEIIYNVTSAPSNGELRVDGSPVGTGNFSQADLDNGRVTYRPNSNYNGSDSFTFDLEDDGGKTGASGETFNIQVDPVNDAPSISDLGDKSIDEDKDFDASFTVDDQETDPGNLSVSASSDNTSLVPNDSISLGGSGSDRTIDISPVKNGNGTADITVAVGDDGDGSGGPATTTATFTLTVDAVNDPPVIVENNPLPVQKDGRQTIEPADLSSTDVDDADEDLMYEVTSVPEYGELVGPSGTPLNSGESFKQKAIQDGNVEYNHTGQVTDDAVTFTVTDGDAGPSVTFEIVPFGTNEPPNTQDDTYSVDEDRTLRITQNENGVLANDEDPEGGTLRASLVSPPSNGQLLELSGGRSISESGTFVYEPNADFNGTDQFTYEATDRNGGTAQATVTITVNPVNDAPEITTNQGLTVDENSSATLSTSNLSASDVDDDPSTLTFSVTSDGSPTQGRLLMNGSEASSFTQEQLANGQVSYEHTASSLDNDEIVFDLTDDSGAGPSDVSFAVDISEVNLAPTAADDRYLASQGQTLSVNSGDEGVLGNDTDPDGDELETSVVTSPSHGTLSLNADGTFQYTPNSGFNGEDTFEYRSADGNGGSDEAEASIQVRPRQTGLSVSRSFPNPTQKRSFRLVALPGTGSPSLASTLRGERGSDWRAFRELGATDTSSYGRQRCDSGTSCSFTPGSGFWLIARESWSIEDSLRTVTLDEDSVGKPVFRIPLEEGWNVISNPLEEDVSWSAVQSASGTNQSIYRWSGDWSKTQTFSSAKSGEAYYFRPNPNNVVDTLVVPFPGMQTPASQSKMNPNTASEPAALSLHAVQNRDTLSTVIAGRRDGAKAGLDSTDQYGPPAYFGTASLRFRQTTDDPERTHALRTEYKPKDREGRVFNLRLTTRSDSALTLVGRGLSSFPGEEVILVNEAVGRPHDLRSDSTVTVAPQSSTTDFKLLIGSKSFVDSKQEDIAPAETELLPNYPNPFRRTTTIEYSLAEETKVRLEVYDILGRRIQVLVNDTKRAGFHRLQWQGDGSGGRPVASGMYFARLVAGSTTETERLVVVR